MKIDHIGIDSLEYSYYGTAIKVGYRFSESDGDGDDWTLDSVTIQLANPEVTPLLDAIVEKFKHLIDLEIKERLSRRVTNSL